MSGSGRPTTPQQIIETALAAARSDGCVVVVETLATANVRWANNTVTTNGVTDSLSWFVVAVLGGAAGTVAGSAADTESDEAIRAVVRAAEDAARAAAASGPSRDQQPWVTGEASAPFVNRLGN